MKNENLKLILTGLMMLLGANALIYVGNNVVPTRYQFNPEIWGTVSDWTMIFITLVTAVFLYKTLRSQQEVQKMQQKLTDIEGRKYRFSLLPEIEHKPLDMTPINIAYSDIEKDKTVINDSFDFRIDFEKQFIINARLLDTNFNVLKEGAVHLKNGTIYLEFKHPYFSGQKIKRINDLDGKGMVAYSKLIIEIEDRDGVKSLIWARIRLELERYGSDQTQGRINKLSKLKYQLGIGVNKDDIISKK